MPSVSPQGSASRVHGSGRGWWSRRPRRGGPIGPDGGDARSLAADPRNPDRILLGTSSSQLFVSNDGGYTWSRLARVGDGDHYVVDHIVFNPTHPETIYAAAWSVETDGGDVFRSDDGGRTWHALAGMHGKSVRSFALAASDPSILVAGALDGVFRSRDARRDAGSGSRRRDIPSSRTSNRWPSIRRTPRSSMPAPGTCRGRPWMAAAPGTSIKEGVVDDSDVFSIILDPRDARVLYASACTGIYKSEDAGAHFRRVQGIPNSARRTRVLRQHPLDPNMVYAGTTEGLWASINAGQSWRRVTADTRDRQRRAGGRAPSWHRAAGHRPQRRAAQREWRNDLLRLQPRFRAPPGDRRPGGPQRPQRALCRRGQ